MTPTTSPEKIAVGKAAADLIENGMSVGLGTGSTAHCFIESLIARCRKGLKITAVATSKRSWKQAEQGGITMLDIEKITSLDLVIDGADEIDPQKRMIKGGGGALLREKIIASTGREMVVIVDNGKLVDKLGAFPLPVEIVPFAHTSTIARLNKKGYQGNIRQSPDGSYYLTDGGHYIYDIQRQSFWDDPEADNLDIIQTPGVVETGFFLNLAGRVLVGQLDGTVLER